MEGEIQKALRVLRSGGTILCPTDTLWGISCDATNPIAVEKIFKIKERDPSKGLIVLIDDEKWLNKYVKEVPAIAWDLIEISDKPLSIIYDNARGIAANALATDGSIAIRLCKDESCKKLIYKFGKPIISTSANSSGDPAPQKFSDINTEILSAVDYVVNWRQHETTTNSASSLIKLKLNGEIKIIRK